MKFMMSLFVLIFASQVFAAAKEPKEIIFACKSKNVGTTTTQIYGRVADGALVDVTYILIDAWDADVAPIVRKGETWVADSNYKPTKKYAGWNRFKIQENTNKLVGYEVIFPSKSMVYAAAMKQAKDKGEDRMVQGDFEAVLRAREDFHDDTGGQEYLKCGTGWLDVK